MALQDLINSKQSFIQSIIANCGAMIIFGDSGFDLAKQSFFVDNETESIVC